MDWHCAKISCRTPNNLFMKKLSGLVVLLKVQTTSFFVGNCSFGFLHSACQNGLSDCVDSVVAV